MKPIGILLVLAVGFGLGRASLPGTPRSAPAPAYHYDHLFRGRLLTRSSGAGTTEFLDPTTGRWLAMSALPAAIQRGWQH